MRQDMPTPLQRLVETLPDRFPEMDREWWSKVVLPPFESRPTRVWSR